MEEIKSRDFSCHFDDKFSISLLNTFSIWFFAALRQRFSHAQQDRPIELDENEWEEQSDLFLSKMRIQLADLLIRELNLSPTLIVGSLSTKSDYRSQSFILVSDLFLFQLFSFILEI